MIERINRSLTTDLLVIFRLYSRKNFFKYHYLTRCKCLVYQLFHLFLTYYQFYQNLLSLSSLSLSLSIYIYIFFFNIYIKKYIRWVSDSMIEICGNLDKWDTLLRFNCVIFRGRVSGVMVIVGDTSSNPGRDWFAFHIALIPLEKVWIQLFSLQLCVNSRTDWVLQPWWGN